MGNRSKRKKLSRKMTAICGAFVLVLSVTLGLLGIYTYYDSVMKRYQQYVTTIIRIADSYIELEDMVQCIQTKEKTKTYERTQAQLDNLKSRSDVQYLYVIQPLNRDKDNNSMYVWSAVTEEEKKDPLKISSLGDLSEADFPGSMANSFQEAMDSEEEITYCTNTTKEYGYMLTGMHPLRLGDGRTEALICVDISMNHINRDILRHILFVLCSTVVVGAVFFTVFLHLVGKGVVSPVIRMARSTEDFVGQSNDGTDPSQLVFQDPMISTGDEIELLCGNLKEMTSRLVVYMGDLQYAAAEKERISAELNVTARITSSMLPDVFPAFPERTEFDIFASLRTAPEMSGDFYDFFFVDRDRLALVIGDVNGFGVPAALLIVITQTLIKNYAKLGFEPAKVFSEANNQLSESNEGMTITAFLGILDLTTGSFTYVNAGHRTPLLKRSGGEFERLPAKDCFVLGGMEGVPYWQQSVQLVQGDMLFLYTEGLVEAKNKEQMQYSMEYMHMQLNRILNEVYELPEVLGRMMEEVEEFMGEESQEQDITMLMLRYFGM